MSEDTSPTKSSCDSQIPPPPDPFPTYQTPYPRSAPLFEDQNPFILFKRFADTQLSSLFSDIPSFFGGASRSNSNFSSSHVQPESPDKQTSQKQLEYLKSSLTEIENAVDKWREERFGDDEGRLKRLEQDWEERRMRIEQRLNNAGGKASLEQQKRKHTSGSLPDPADELDLYEHAFGQNNFHTYPIQQAENFHNATRRISSSREDSSFPDGDRNNDIFDPVIGKRQAFLWWTNSPYSPLRLRSQSDQSNSEERKAKSVDWDAAFHDLLQEGANSAGDNNGMGHESVWRTNLVHSYQAARRFKGLNGPIYASGIDKRQSANNWMAELDAALNTHWPKIWKGVRSIVNNGEERPEALTQSSTFSRNFSWSSEESPKPNDVIYNITSINTQRLSDGSIETRKVTTVGYRDGREESKEVVNMRPPIRQADTVTSDSVAPENVPKLEIETQKLPLDTSHDETTQETRRAGKGWFWN